MKDTKLERGKDEDGYAPDFHYGMRKSKASISNEEEYGAVLV